MAYRFIRTLARLLLPLQMRLRIDGRERVPARGPLILVANHLGLLDPFAVALRIRRQVHFLAKAETFEWLIIGGAARWSGMVPVRRGASDREALRMVIELLAKGQCVVLMPEGTYPKVPLPPAMLRAKTGAAFLAAHTGAPVLPVGITGTERVWAPKRGWRVWHRPRVTVTFGEPYHPKIPRGVSIKVAYQMIADDMGRRIAALLPASYRGYYADAGAPATEPAGAQGAAAAPPDALSGLTDQQRAGQDRGVE